MTVMRLTEPPRTLAEVRPETAWPNELEAVKDAGADEVLVDNMPIETIREAVELARGKACVEASGGVTIDTVRAIAETGVDYISIGALTHSPPAMNLALDFD